jgi:MSHA biogenesis protein MshJ
MNAKLLQALNRLEDLSLRERILLVVGVPLALVAVGEALLFGPGRDQAERAAQEAERQRAELASLQAVLSTQQAAAPLPAADQLQRELRVLQQRLEAARDIQAAVSQPMAWGAVVRTTASGTRGLTLTQLKTLPTETVFSPAMARQVSAPAGKPGAAGAAQPPAVPASLPDVPTIYRHRAELAIEGDFTALLRYLQGLQRVPGALYWERLQFSAAKFPQASLQLSLYTLSDRAETPFN